MRAWLRPFMAASLRDKFNVLEISTSLKAVQSMVDDTKHRKIEFSSLSQVKNEARRLRVNGYRQSGNWNLAQICGHLNCWMGYPMDGFPRVGFPVNAVLWTFRMTVGKRILHKILNEKSMKAGSPTVPVSVLETDACSEEDAVQQLEQTIDRFESFKGTVHPSPAFGTMDYETARKLQLVHCAHHLGFLIPGND